jgi:hypothetical protein
MISILKLLRLWIPFGQSGSVTAPDSLPIQLYYAVPVTRTLTYTVPATVSLYYDQDGEA